MNLRLLLVLGLVFAVCNALPFGRTRTVRERFSKHGHNAFNHEHPKVEGSVTHFYTEAIRDHAYSIADGPVFWEQRFYADQSFWCGEGCPVFLYIGGEGAQGPISKRLIMYTLAQEHNALILALEHRYYGESYPVPDMTTSNLRYLTSEQAQGDLARFRNYVSTLSPGKDTASNPPLLLQASARDSDWIVFGGSYPGNMAAWFKLKYPSLAVGSVASSAPVYAEYNYEQYAQVVGFAMAKESVGGSQSCYDIIDAATTELHSLVMSTYPYGTSPSIPYELKPCSGMKNQYDVATYESELFGNFQGAVQYNLEGRGLTVEDLCTSLTRESQSPLEAFAATTALFTESTCISSNYQNDYIGFLTNTTFSGRGCDLDCSAERQWIWQSCNEFGYFQTTTGVNHPFRAFALNDIDAAGDTLCKLAYGMKNFQEPNTLWANTNYGNRRIQGVNITMPNGNVDPWHALSVIPSSDDFYNSCTGGICNRQVVGEGNDVVFIDGTAHCRDMYSPGALEGAGVEDTAEVQAAHARIMANVAKYLQK